MSWFILLLGAGFVVSAVLVRRHEHRTPPPPAPTDITAQRLRPVDAWQCGIKLEPAKGYTSEAHQRAWQKLREEELRQRPWEGRN